MCDNVEITESHALIISRNPHNNYQEVFAPAVTPLL